MYLYYHRKTRACLEKERKQDMSKKANINYLLNCLTIHTARSTEEIHKLSKRTIIPNKRYHLVKGTTCRKIEKRKKKHTALFVESCASTSSSKTSFFRKSTHTKIISFITSNLSDGSNANIVNYLWTLKLYTTTYRFLFTTTSQFYF